MKRTAGVIAIALVFAGCTPKGAPAPNGAALPVPGAPASAPSAGKRHLEGIPQMPLDVLKLHYDECMEFKDIADPRVPWLVEDCREVRGRWDRRDSQQSGVRRKAPTLPQLH